MSERVTVQDKIGRSATTNLLDERINPYQSIGGTLGQNGHRYIPTGALIGGMQDCPLKSAIVLGFSAARTVNCRQQTNALIEESLALVPGGLVKGNVRQSYCPACRDPQDSPSPSTCLASHAAVVDDIAIILISRIKLVPWLKSKWCVNAIEIR
jgi:hypothetical protein